MTVFNESLLAAMKAMINANEWRDDYAEKVTGYREVQQSGGFCDTCSYEYTEVHIDYIGTEGNELTYEYSGDFGELIRTLAKY